MILRSALTIKLSIDCRLAISCLESETQRFGLCVQYVKELQTRRDAAGETFRRFATELQRATLNLSNIKLYAVLFGYCATDRGQRAIRHAAR